MGGTARKRTQAQIDAEKRYNAKRSERHQIWTGIFYEESCPEWRDYLDELTLPVAVSPAHDQDAWTALDEKKDPAHKAGTIKKEHRHWLAEYPNPVTYKQVLEDFDFLGCKSIKWVKSMSSMANYLTHAKSKDKVQYDPKEILEFGGANWRDWCARTDDLHGEMLAMRKHIIEHARETRRADLYEFWLWCDENNDTWSRLLDTCCSASIERFMKTVRGAIKTGTWERVMTDAAEVVVVDDTGKKLAEFETVYDAEEYIEYLSVTGRTASVKVNSRDGLPDSDTKK